jgi:hypothetical protein
VADIFCNQCGHRNPQGSRFCSSCGASLETRGEDHTATLQAIDTGGTDAVDAAARPAPADLPEGGGVLIVKRGPGSGSRFVLEGTVTSAGRHPESDIFLDDITVSRRHVELERTGDGYVVRDVGSLNGTYVNRERIEEAVLRDGDELQIGAFKLVFFAGGSR